MKTSFALIMHHGNSQKRLDSLGYNLRTMFSLICSSLFTYSLGQKKKCLHVFAIDYENAIPFFVPTVRSFQIIIIPSDPLLLLIASVSLQSSLISHLFSTFCNSQKFVFFDGSFIGVDACAARCECRQIQKAKSKAETPWMQTTKTISQ